MTRRQGRGPARAGGGGVRIERYKHGRHWAVIDRGELVAVTLYRKGAEAVRDRLRASRPAKRRTRLCRL